MTGDRGRDTDVLVVGAGPTGLALGVDLARRGVDALVLERADGLFPAPGKGDPAPHHGGLRRPRRPRRDPRGRRRLPARPGLAGRPARGGHSLFDSAEPDEGAPYSEPWMVPQWRTQEILLARLEELGGRVLFGREVRHLGQDADGVTVRCADGTRLRARYAVAADGGRSAVRRALGIGMTGETVDPQPILVADVRIRGLDRGHWHIFPPPGEDGAGFLAVCPLAGTEDFQVVARFPEGSEVDLSADGVRATVAARSHLAARDVTQVRWASDFRPRAALADRFRAGRVLLAGDAAHVHSPAGGQGLNTSVQDAYNLGWKLGAVLRDGAPAELLDSYEEERRPVAARMLGLSTGVHRGEVRRGAATRQLGITYRTSSLARETRPAPGPVRAGDRAPDATADGVRLFEAFRGPHWTLLAAAVPPPPVPAAVRVVRTPAVAPYGAGLFLVRPDGHVGWAADAGAAGLTGYLARVGLR